MCLGESMPQLEIQTIKEKHFKMLTCNFQKRSKLTGSKTGETRRAGPNRYCLSIEWVFVSFAYLKYLNDLALLKEFHR
jgi:hypothetical protein